MAVTEVEQWQSDRLRVRARAVGECEGVAVVVCVQVVVLERVGWRIEVRGQARLTATERAVPAAHAL